MGNIFQKITESDGVKHMKLSGLNWFVLAAAIILLGVLRDSFIGEEILPMGIEPQAAAPEVENAPENEAWKDLQMTIQQAEYDEVIRLTQDIRAAKDDSGLIVPQNASITLDLAGHVLDRGLRDETHEGYVMKVRGKLTVIDSGDKNRGRITGGYNSGDGGAIVVEKNGTLSLEGGSLYGNRSSGNGGAVYVHSGGSFDMSGGRIEKNSCDGNGGGICIKRGAFELYGGEIRDNVSEENGGAIVDLQGEVVLLDGTVAGNTAGNTGGGLYVIQGTLEMGSASVEDNRALYGGGAYLSKSSFSMRDGVIRGNTADKRGGGVLFRDCIIKLSDSPVIAENQCTLSGGGEPNNVCIEKKAVIGIDAPLAPDAHVGVSSECHVFTRGLANSGNDGAFFADSGLFVIESSEDSREARLALAPDGGADTRIQPWTGDFEYIAYSGILGEPRIHMNSKEFFEHYSTGNYAFSIMKGDVRPTADHGIVMCHDASFTLNSQGRITAHDRKNCVNIHDLTLEQCLSLRYDNIFDGQYTSMCDFETYISTCARNNKWAYITIRDEYIPEMLDTMIPLIYRYGMQHRCIVNSFELDSLKMVKQVDPSIRLSWVITNRKLTTDIVDQAAALGNCALTLYSFKDGLDRLELLALYEYEIIYAQSKDIPLYAAIARIPSKVERLKRLGIRGAQFIVSVYDN
ncbi:MAG: hypothetical protein IKF98_10130 [Clostridia bacterium]|nr:hypothetical protein [Clostridia bacterium]